MESKRITKTEDDYPFERSQSQVEPSYNGPILIGQSEENSQLESSKQYLRNGGKQSNLESSDKNALDKSDAENSLQKNKLGLKYGEKVKKIRKNWLPDEQRRYLGFISEPIRQAELEATQKKKKQRIYNHMSNRIQTRNSRQCKSHHQKMIAKYQTLSRTIELLSMELDTTKIDVTQPLKKKKATLEPEYIV